MIINRKLITIIGTYFGILLILLLVLVIVKKRKGQDLEIFVVDYPCRADFQVTDAVASLTAPRAKIEGPATAVADPITGTPGFSYTATASNDQGKLTKIELHYAELSDSVDLSIGSSWKPLIGGKCEFNPSATNAICSGTVSGLSVGRYIVTANAYAVDGTNTKQCSGNPRCDSGPCGANNMFTNCGTSDSINLNVTTNMTCAQKCGVSSDSSTTGPVQKANYTCVQGATYHGQVIGGTQCFCATCTPVATGCEAILNQGTCISNISCIWTENATTGSYCKTSTAISCNDIKWYITCDDKQGCGWTSSTNQTGDFCRSYESLTCNQLMDWESCQKKNCAWINDQGFGNYCRDLSAVSCTDIKEDDSCRNKSGCNWTSSELHSGNYCVASASDRLICDLDEVRGCSINDFMIFADYFNRSDMRADLNGSRTITIDDFMVFAQAY